MTYLQLPRGAASLLAVALLAFAEPNGLARRPQMGWCVVDWRWSARRTGAAAARRALPARRTVALTTATTSSFSFLLPPFPPPQEFLELRAGLLLQCLAGTVSQ